MPKLIPREYVLRVCQPGTENACSYLMCSSNGFECAKGTEFEKSCKQKECLLQCARLITIVLVLAMKRIMKIILKN